MGRMKFMGTILLLLVLVTGCDDSLDIRRDYDFSLTSWYLQSGMRQDETVEIRLTLNREGNYREAGYRIGYIQLEGEGFVHDKNGKELINREIQEISAIAGLDTTDICHQVFTLYYRNEGSDNPEIRFIVVDNFNRERTLDIAWSLKSGNE